MLDVDSSVIGVVTTSGGTVTGTTDADNCGCTAGLGSGALWITGGDFTQSGAMPAGDTGGTYSSGTTAFALTGGTFKTDVDGSGSGNTFKVDADDLMFLSVADGLECVSSGSGYYVLQAAGAQDMAAMWRGGTLRVEVTTALGAKSVAVYSVDSSNRLTEIPASGYEARVSGSTVTVIGKGDFKGTVTCSSADGTYAGTGSATTDGGAQPTTPTTPEEPGEEKKVSYHAVFGTQVVACVVGESGSAFPEGTWLDKDGNVVSTKAQLDALVKADNDVVVLTEKKEDPTPDPTPEPTPEPTPAPEADGWHRGEDGSWRLRLGGTDVTSGWALDGGSWYLFDAEGAMLTGWQVSAGRWYHMSKLHDGSFGAMDTGWLLDAGRWYWLSPQAGGPQGAMQTGWQLVGGKWYYLDARAGGPLGALLQSTTTPDGYQVDASGAWIQ